MRIGAPTLAGRVAPRCIYADGLLLITVTGGRIVRHRHLDVLIRTPADLTALLETNHVDTLISGGVGSSVRQLLDRQGIRVIDNVSQTVEALLEDIPTDSRFGGGSGASVETAGNNSETGCPCDSGGHDAEINCLTCPERVCLLGRPTPEESVSPIRALSHTERRMLQAAMDIAKEGPRRLCRLSEIVYFCIEMNYERIGLAYCTELEDAAGILVNVLGRFFEVVPICCKVDGIRESALYQEDDPWLESEGSVVCNPLGQARVLNDADTQFNLVVGLCVGADALFNRESKAPASTLFVKDKSLANNPIGALYSEYYLKESVSQATGDRRRE